MRTVSERVHSKMKMPRTKIAVSAAAGFVPASAAETTAVLVTAGGVTAVGAMIAVTALVLIALLLARLKRNGRAEERELKIQQLTPNDDTRASSDPLDHRPSKTSASSAPC